MLCTEYATSYKSKYLTFFFLSSTAILIPLRKCQNSCLNCSISLLHVKLMCLWHMCYDQSSQMCITEVAQRTSSIKMHSLPKQFFCQDPKSVSYYCTFFITTQSISAGIRYKRRCTRTNRQSDISTQKSNWESKEQYKRLSNLTAKARARQQRFAVSYLRVFD